MGSGEGCWERIVENHTVGEACVEALVEVLKCKFCPAFMIGASLDDSAVGVWRITELFSEFELLIGVAVKIVVSGKLD